jgi:hypothetical protein
MGMSTDLWSRTSKRLQSEVALKDGSGNQKLAVKPITHARKPVIPVA